jgi:hypothetical protein
MTAQTLLGAALVTVLVAAPVASGEPLFPFVISYDAPETIINVSAWLDRPAGRHGFVRADKGRLSTDAGPIRFWATNLCFEACFPSREQAERVAARVASLGINCVRMHHMDSHSIWGDGRGHLEIDPKKLDRLDYLVYQLKLKGIYTNLNLHVSRWFDERDGFSNRDQRPHYDKGLDNFEPRMIELQKKYARDLLTHVNPYTKTAYRDEPAVAFVEISNEDALYAVWGWGQLDELPEPYAGTFRKLWNAWLRKKYGTTAKLRAAWNAQERPLGKEMLADGGFSDAWERHWSLERDDQTAVQWAIEPAGPGDKGRCLRVAVTRQGRVAWRPQFSQPGLTVKKGSPYTLSFRLRGDKKGRISMNCMMAHDPWERLGLSASVPVTTEWKEQRFTFVAEQDDPNARITFSDLRPGTYWLADASLRPGGIVGLAPNQRLDDDSAPVMRRSEAGLTETARADFMDFLWDTERDYWWGMYRFLKDDLKVRSLVAGTQLGYSPVHVQAGLDYVDAHSYWQHPHFPRRPWDPRDWTVRNVALVNSPGGTLAGLAVHRVAGMAYTVSEYNHPAPNAYAAEGFPMIAAFGGFQGWDGVYSFTYSHSTDFEPRRITGFFDVKSETAKLAHMPACAAMFLRGDVASATKTLLVPVSAESERKKLHETLSAWTLTAEGLGGIDPRLSLVHGLALELTKGKPAAEKPVSGEPMKDAKVFISDTAQIRWDLSEQGAGCFTVDTPRTKLFTGFVRGRTFTLGGVTLAVGPTRLDWATVSMVSIDGQGFDKRGRILIAATGWIQNAGAELKDLGDDQVTLGDRWGSEPVQCEGVPAEITLPVAAGRVRLHPLDESGRRREAVPVVDRDGKAVVAIGPKHKTVWYEVQIAD